MGALGTLFYYAASANLALALTAGTCTQGDAGRLWGGLISLGLFGFGSVFLLQTSRGRIVVMFLVPPMAILGWATVFTAKFVTFFWFFGRSACDALDGTNGQMLSGDEPLLTALWVLICVFVWAVVIALGRLAWREARESSFQD